MNNRINEWLQAEPKGFTAIDVGSEALNVETNLNDAIEKNPQIKAEIILAYLAKQFASNCLVQQEISYCSRILG